MTRAQLDNAAVAGALEPALEPAPWWRRRPDAPVLVLIGAMVLWTVVFGVLVYQRHDRFASFGFDMGIFDQAIWLVARGESFITVRGLDFFGHHASVAFYLLAPFSWAGAGPHVWNLLQVGTLALGALPLYLLGRPKLGRWLALVPALAFLLHPSLQFLAWELFHPETMAITPLLFAYLAAQRDRWGWYTALVIFSVAWKEDVALFAFFLGLVVLIQGHRRVGALTMGLSLGWFLAVTQLILPVVNGEGAFYSQFYADLGDSPAEIVRNAIVHPTRVLDKLDDSAFGYLFRLVAPFGFVVVAAPLVLLLALPQLVANILSVHGFTREITFHYAALPLAALALASVEGLAQIGRWFGSRVRGLLAAALAVAAVVGTVQLGPSPVGAAYDDGFWPIWNDPRLEARETAVELVPDGVAVSATYAYVPHLTHRRRVYEFPNPFRERNWGVRGENRHDPDVVEWLIVDETQAGPADQALAESLVESDQFEVVMDRSGVIVARRIAPS